MPLWQGWNWRDGNFGGSGLQPLQLPPEIADTVIDQLLAIAAALGKPIQLDDR
jgi:hypothetical protein